MPNLVAGLIELYVGEQLVNAKGNFTYSLGGVTREGVAGADRTHGYTEKVAIPFLEGKLTDRIDFDVAALRALTDTTVQLKRGKTIIFRNAWFAGDAEQTTEDGEISVRFEALSAEEQLG